MACWGGVGDTLSIDMENNTPVFLIHGTNDAIVPFTSGAPFSLNNISPVYGSYSISERLNSLEIPAEQTYFVPNAGHGFYGVLNGHWINGFRGNEYWDTIVKKATAFYWSQHKPQAGFTYSCMDMTIQCSDTSSGATSWIWDFGDGNFSTQQNPVHTYTTHRKYQMKLYVENNIQSWDTTSKTITISTNPTKTTFSDKIIIYPNPAQAWIYVDFSQSLKQVVVELYDVYGKRIIVKSSKSDFGIRMDISKLNS